MIFDCDGVLVDTERLTVQVYATMLGRLGWQLTTEQMLERFLGRTHQHMVQQIEAYLGHDLPLGWEAEYRKTLDDAFESDLKAVDGIRDALKDIRIRDCVASSGGHERIRKTLSLTGLYAYFKGRIYSATEVRSGKPAPDLFLHAARQMGIAPAECVVVEDSPAGIQAAHSAGMRALGYAGGITPRCWLETPGTIVFSDMRRLPMLLKTGMDG